MPEFLLQAPVLAPRMAGSFVASGGLLLPINFAWDANPIGENVKGYKLYYGASSGVYTANIPVGNVTSYLLPNPGVTRYYAVTATNATGESAFSNELIR